jgi:predicted DNA-binding transcriptional regulator YafY
MPKPPARGDTTERSVLIPLLLAERPHTQRELARELEVDAVTIRRAIKSLSLHHPITEERDGREMRYDLLSAKKYASPDFTPAELAALLLAQQSIAATGVTLGAPFAAVGRVLVQKVRAALPPSLRDKLDALSSIFGSATVAAKDYAPHAGTIDRLTTAAVTRRRVRLRYHALHNDTVTERDFDPYAVYFDPDGATLKVIGRDHKDPERAEPIPLSIDRILSVADTPQTFERPADFDLHEFLTEYCFNGIHGEPMAVRLCAYGVTARIFAERKFHPSHRVVAQAGKAEGQEESTTIEMRVARGRGLVRFVLGWLPDVEVLDPPELRRDVAEACRRGLARSGGE